MDLDNVLKEFNKNWRAQAFMWYRKWLVCRKQYKQVLMQKRELQKVIFDLKKRLDKAY